MPKSLSVNKKEIYSRTNLLLGDEVCTSISDAKVILFGVGGVGSWCAEGLVRSGIENLTLVDFDIVSVSNINRQLMATVLTVGQPKTEALKERLLSINPEAKITTIQRKFTEESAESFNLGSYDYVIDAIDTLKDKAKLIYYGADCGAIFFSSLGSALKIDPTKIYVKDFWKVRDCPLGAALRKKMRQSKTVPQNSFLCVCGDQVLENKGISNDTNEEAAASGKAVINGSLAHITAIFGMTLAGLVLEDIWEKASK